LQFAHPLLFLRVLSKKLNPLPVAQCHQTLNDNLPDFNRLTQNLMKSKGLILAIVSAAILFLGAARISKMSTTEKSATVSKGTIGGLVSEDK